MSKKILILGYNNAEAKKYIQKNKLNPSHYQYVWSRKNLVNQAPDTEFIALQGASAAKTTKEILFEAIAMDTFNIRLLG